MKRSRFSEEQIIATLKAQKNGLEMKDVCRQHQLYYNATRPHSSLGNLTPREYA